LKYPEGRNHGNHDKQLARCIKIWILLEMLDVLAPKERLPEACWILDLVSRLDWLGFQELVSHLLQRSGYLPEVAWTRPDGGTALTLMHPARSNRLEAIVQCPPWQSHEIDAAMLRDLHQVVVREGAQRGIYLTPGTFTAEARAFARLKPLELVDGSDLVLSFQRLPDEERTELLRMITAVPYSVPSCPSCLRKMERIEDAAAASRQRERDLVYKISSSESSVVDCRSLTLRKKADVVFLKGLTAGAMTVHGKATGNIVVNGRLHVAAGGSVSGLVSARAIQLDPGGTLEAEARILNESEIAHFQPLPPQQVWRCPAFPKCRDTLPVRPQD
jgi:hypothetical protein